MPDAGEWLCVEMDGVVYCRGTGDAAGVDPGSRDEAFVCGGRHGHDNEEICVDLSSDPPPAPVPFRCHFRYASGVAERVCARSNAPQVGTHCAHDTACPEGSRCVGHICLPRYPEPGCWFDEDCPGNQRCRWGTCAPNHNG